MAVDCSDQPFNHQQRVEHQAQQIAATMSVAMALREVYDFAREKLFSHPDIELVGASSSIGIHSLQDAFALTQSLTESDMAYGRQVLQQLLEGQNAQH